MITAKELIDQKAAVDESIGLKKDGVDEKRVMLREFERAVLSDLAEVGVVVRGVGSRFSTHSDNVKALPVFSKYIQMDIPAEIREALARSMVIPESIEYRGVMLGLFSDLGVDESVRYAVGLVVAKTTNSNNFSETLALIKDPRLGKARMSLLSTIKVRRKNKAVAELVGELVADLDLGREVASW